MRFYKLKVVGSLHSVFLASAALLAFTLQAAGQLVITTGIDTTLPSASGQMGSDAPHGAQAAWEWDGDDGGGENLGLLWFDIPQSVLDSVASSSNVTATLALYGDNEGASADVHRVTIDWLSGPDGGNDVTFNNFPDGPGIEPGINAEQDPSFMTGDLGAGELHEFDVADDIRAWGGGDPNYGWAFLPTGTNGTGITSFENASNPVPTLTISGISTTGDINGDGTIDLADFGILLSNFNTTGVGEGDLTFDGRIDLRDFLAFREEFLAAAAGAATAASVPEPGAALALLLGAIGLAAAVRRRRSEAR